ncbi:MAG: flippase-like domain-containing protein [Planctomycetota bacterium]
MSDRVELKDGSVLKGIVETRSDEIHIVLSGGDTKTVPRNELALNADGSPKIELGLRSAWWNSSKVWLIVAVLIHAPVALLQAVRFVWLLGVQGIRMGYWQSVKLAFAGNFLNFAAPLGSNAGDVFKAYFASLHTTRKTEAVTTVVLDRVIGLATLVFVASLITLLSPSDNPLAKFRLYMATALAIGAIGIVVYLLPWPRRLLPRLLGSFHHPILDQIRRVDQAARSLARHLGVVFAAVLVTAALQGLAMGAYFVVAIAVGMDAGRQNALEYYAYYAAGAVIQALPGPPQGLGTVELAYRYFFSSLGSPSQIVCMAFVSRAVVLFCALPGALVAATGSYRPGRSHQDPSSTDSEFLPAPSPRSDETVRHHAGV